MAEPGRRLTAIMFTDIVGYSAVMAADELRALALVERSRALVLPRVEANGGRCLEHETAASGSRSAT